MGNLNFLKIVDAHRIVVAFSGQKNLNEVTHHAELDELARIVLLVHGKRLIRRACSLAARHEVLLPDALRHLLKWKRVQSPAHVAALVAIGEAAHKDRIERRARHDAELAKFGDGLGQAPIGHTDAHAALNNLRKLEHA